MLTTASTDQLALATALAAIVTMLIGIARPFVEQLPFARPNAPTHDATLRLLNLTLNVGLVVAAAAASGQLSGASWLALIIQALAQASGSHLFFHSVSSSSGGSAANGASAAPTTTSSTAAPVASSASSAPPVASAVSAPAPASAQTAQAATTAAVQDAVSSAIASQFAQ